MDVYDELQFGGGNIERGVGRVYAGSRYQRGHGGIGTFLSVLFRTKRPLLQRGAKAVGKEALHAGRSVVSDTASNTLLKESLRTRVR